MHRFPNGAGTKGFWHKQLPDHAPDWLPRWDNPEAEPRRHQHLPGRRRAGGAGLGRQLRRAGVARLDLADRRAAAADLRADRPRPGPATTWDDMLTLARLHRTALEHLGVRGQPKVTGRRGIQIWIPIARGPSSTRPGPGSSSCPGPSARWCPSWSAGSGRSATAAAWPGWTTPRTRSTRRWSRRTARAPRPARPSPRRSTGTSSTTPTLRPDGFTIRTVLDRLAERGDPFRAGARQRPAAAGDPLTRRQAGSGRLATSIQYRASSPTPVRSPDRLAGLVT